MAGSVLNRTLGIFMYICAKLNICAFKTATSPSREPLADIINKRHE